MSITERTSQLAERLTYVIVNDPEVQELASMFAEKRAADLGIKIDMVSDEGVHYDLITEYIQHVVNKIAVNLIGGLG